MTKKIQNFMIVMALVLSFSSVAFSQGSSPQEKIPVKVQIVVSRFDGDRKVGSLPFTLLATANGEKAYVNSGAQVPTLSTGTSDGKPIETISYTNVGTNVTCTVTTEAGRFKVNLDFSDHYVIDVKPAPGAKPFDPQSYRTFNYDSAITMKEGETKQFASVADRITGEVVKIDVTVTLDK